MKRGRSLVTRRCFGLAHATTAAGSDQAQPGSSESSSSSEAGDRLVAAVFDPLRAFRAFGVTAGGELVVLTVPSGMAAHACKVRVLLVHSQACGVDGTDRQQLPGL
jgi:hypothetical protein